jgi:hypothetical protein
MSENEKARGGQDSEHQGGGSHETGKPGGGQQGGGSHEPGKPGGGQQGGGSHGQ